MVKARIARGAGIFFGVFVHVLLLLTAWRLFWFLKEGGSPVESGALGWNALLALQFAVVHSILLLPRVRRGLSAWIGPEFYGCFFCAATCVCLLILLAGWRSSPMTLWEWQGGARTGVELAFLASWAAMFYSMSLTGLGHQTGLTHWLCWLRGRPLPQREFRPRGAYLLLRHPVYLSFLGLVWFTPVMSLDRAVLAAVWTVYVFVGSYLKDQRMAHYLGDAYRAYQAQVAGYPLFPGPLGKLRVPRSGPDDEAGPSKAAA